MYSEKIVNALIYLWRMSDYLCGKRLHVYIREVIPVLEKFNEIHFDRETKEELISISPATIDRLLKDEKMKFSLKGRSKTLMETLLKHNISIRTFADWVECQSQALLRQIL
jgi:hypothetical protein